MCLSVPGNIQNTLTNLTLELVSYKYLRLVLPRGVTFSLCCGRKYKHKNCREKLSRCGGQDVMSLQHNGRILRPGDSFMLGNCQLLMLGSCIMYILIGARTSLARFMINSYSIVWYISGRWLWWCFLAVLYAKVFTSLSVKDPLR